MGDTLGMKCKVDEENEGGLQNLTQEPRALYKSTHTFHILGSGKGQGRSQCG